MVLQQAAFYTSERKIWRKIDNFFNCLHNCGIKLMYWLIDEQLLVNDELCQVYCDGHSVLL